MKKVNSKKIAILAVSGFEESELFEPLDAFNKKIIGKIKENA